MLEYYLLVLLPFIPFIFQIKNREVDPNKNSILIFFIGLFLLLALRAPTIGRDLENYQYIFKICSKQSWKSLGLLDIEIAYAVINKVVSVFTTNFQWLLIISSMICIIPLAIVYYIEIEDSILTISTFLMISNFVLLFSGLRQSIAISIGMIAFIFVKKKRIIPFTCMILLAFLFHKSAFVLAIMYPLYHTKITKKALWFISPILIAFFVYRIQVFSFLGDIFNGIYTAEIDKTNAFGMLILLLVLLVYFYIISDESEIDESVNGLRNFILFCFVIQMFSSLHTLVMRMGYYYLIFLPLLIPKVNTNCLEKWEEVAVISRYVMIIFFLCWFFITAPKVNSLDSFPYQFFWEIN